jgi:hypothetical protein
VRSAIFIDSERLARTPDASRGQPAAGERGSGPAGRRPWMLAAANLLLLLALLVAGRGGASARHISRRSDTTVMVPSYVLGNLSADSRPYRGHGALSAGASSRLLIDYPPKQRAQILDILFLPGYGASLDLLKIEIGGDDQSTDGVEPSHSHGLGDLDCNRGWEWWL